MLGNLGSLVTSVRGFVTGLWIRPEQSERVHDQDSPTSRTAAEQEGQSLAVDVEQGRVRCGGDGELAVEKEEGSDCELAEEERDLERRAAGDAAPSSEQSRSSAGDEAEQQQHEERIEILGIDSDSNSDSSGEVCRVCQQHSEEPLITLGCACRGGLARAHRSCIDAWFARKGSNKCEICQEVAANVPAPATQPEQFWIWRVGARRNGRRSTVRFQPLWAALMILIAGLLFDILISIFLGASALPVNIIIGILIVLGVGTVFRLMLECWRTRQIRRLQRTHMRQNPIYQGSNPTEHADDVPQEDVVQHVVQLQRPYQVHAIVVSSHRTVTV